MKDRWVCALSPREVKGDGDAIVCVVNNLSCLGKPEISICQIKHLKEMFEWARDAERKYLLSKMIGSSPCPQLVDDESCMRIIAAAMPKIWKWDGKNEETIECRLPEGVTKENFAECCKAYNSHKGLACEFDEDSGNDDSGPRGLWIDGFYVLLVQSEYEGPYLPWTDFKIGDGIIKFTSYKEAYEEGEKLMKKERWFRYRIIKLTGVEMMSRENIQVIDAAKAVFNIFKEASERANSEGGNKDGER